MIKKRKSRWTINQLKKAVKSSRSFRQVLQKLNLVEAGGNYDHIKREVEENNFSTSHFTGRGWNKGLIISRKPLFSLGEILVRNSRFQSFKLKKRLFKEGVKNPSCELCQWSVITIDGRIPLELDHINGDKYDNRLENLRILCPNCHSMQPTHRGLNQKRKNARVL